MSMFERALRLVKCFLSWFPIVLSCHISLCLDNICLAYSTKANPCKLIQIYRCVFLFYLLQILIHLYPLGLNLTESLDVLTLAEVQNNGWEVLCEICDIWRNLLLSFTYKWSSVSGPDVSQSPLRTAAWKLKRVGKTVWMQKQENNVGLTNLVN